MPSGGTAISHAGPAERTSSKGLGGGTTTIDSIKPGLSVSFSFPRRGFLQHGSSGGAEGASIEARVANHDDGASRPRRVMLRTIGATARPAEFGALRMLLQPTGLFRNEIALFRTIWLVLHSTAATYF